MGSLPPPEVVEDCFGVLKLYSDGTIFRSNDIEFKIPLHDDGSVLWKDCLFDKHHNLYLRLYKPAINAASVDKLLPIVYYYHGGGFCLGSRTFPNFHNCCLSLCSGLQAVVVAPDCRLAPEHRLPAAINDAHNALMWLKEEALSKNPDRWLCDGVDLDRVFIVGDSSGGNVAHHLAVRLGAGSKELAPLRVRGYVLLAPFFGGTVRTKSEEERPSEAFWNLEMYDRFWRLSIPEGATLDHPFVNPFGALSHSLEGVALDPILVVVGGSEILKDRVEDYARRLRELGNKIEYVEFEGKQHGFFTDHSFSEEAKGVVQIIKGFMFGIN